MIYTNMKKQPITVHLYVHSLSDRKLILHHSNDVELIETKIEAGKTDFRLEAIFQAMTLEIARKKANNYYNEQFK